MQPLKYQDCISIVDTIANILKENKLSCTDDIHEEREAFRASSSYNDGEKIQIQTEFVAVAVYIRYKECSSIIYSAMEEDMSLKTVRSIKIKMASMQSIDDPDEIFKEIFYLGSNEVLSLVMPLAIKRINDLIAKHREIINKREQVAKEARYKEYLKLKAEFEKE